jgi:hypothetical protein
MIQFYRAVNTIRFIYENKSVVLYREAIAVSSENYTKHKYIVWAKCKVFDPYTLCSYGRGVDSVSNRNEYQEHFVGVNAADA